MVLIRDLLHLLIGGHVVCNTLRRRHSMPRVQVEAVRIHRTKHAANNPHHAIKTLHARIRHAKARRVGDEGITRDAHVLPTELCLGLLMERSTTRNVIGSGERHLYHSRLGRGRFSQPNVGCDKCRLQRTALPQDR